MTFLLKLSFFLFMTKAATVCGQNDGKLITVLLERIEKLEKSDAANKREIVALKSEMSEMDKVTNKRDIEALKSEMSEMKTYFVKREMYLLAEINNLKSELQNNLMVRDEKEPDTASRTLVNNDPIDSTRSLENGYKKDGSKKEKRSVKIRQAVETAVAFYATHSQHDVQHLGQNQIIVFDQAVTNIGNAYHPNNGTFVAPVDGIYVFHVTMMGRDAHTAKHFNAYIDVNGAFYSQLWVEPYQQSSQMFVVDLKTGKTVSVKNHIQDDGFVGQHMSTFSGFLLYERYDAIGIIGK